MEIELLKNEDYKIFGNLNSKNIFIQAVDENDLENMEKQIEYLKELKNDADFSIIALKIKDWNKELTPWSSDAIFGDENFGDGARETLLKIKEEVLTSLKENHKSKDKRYYLIGYSLSGLFCLWSAYQTAEFDGVVAVSPSVWYSGWTEFANKNSVKLKNIYLSLGDREENAKNKVMSSVGDAIRSQYELLKEQNFNSTLEWNEGGHFSNPALRLARGMDWILKNAK